MKFKISSNMNNINIFLSKYNAILFSLFFLIVFRISTLFSGGISSDPIYNLLLYKHFFTNPEYVAYSTNYYLTVYIGSVVNFLIPYNLFVSLRILELIVDILIEIGVYLLFRDFFSKKSLLLSFLITPIIFYNYSVPIFFYNSFSLLFLVYSLLFLYKTIKNKSIKLAFFTGLILSVAIFVRIPNVVYCIIPVITFVFVYVLKIERLEQVIHYQYAYIGGCLIGTLFVLCFVVINGHIGLFYESVSNLFNKSAANSDTHGLNNMLHAMKYWLTIFFFTSFPLLFYPLYSRYKIFFRKKMMLIMYLVLSILSILYVYYYITKYGFTDYRYKLLYVYSVYFIFSIWHIINNNDFFRKMFVLVVLLAAILMPFGCDQYIVGWGYQLVWLTIPVAIGSFTCSVHGTLKDKVFSCFMSVGFIYILLWSVCGCYKCYVEGGVINNDKLRKINVEKNNANDINEKLNRLNNISQSNSLLVIHSNDLVLVYLLDKKPYNIRPINWSSSKDVYENLIKMYGKTKELPDIYIPQTSDYENVPEYKFYLLHKDKYRVNEIGKYGVVLSVI